MLFSILSIVTVSQLLVKSNLYVSVSSFSRVSLLSIFVIYKKSMEVSHSKMVLVEIRIWPSTKLHTNIIISVSNLTLVRRLKNFSHFHFDRRMCIQ